MGAGERLLNSALAASICGGSVLGLGARATTAVGVAILALQLEVAVLVLLRSGCRRNGSARAVLASLPAVAIGGVALTCARPLPEWCAWCEVVFVAGTALTLAAFASLARSFAILPSLRSVVVGGPYRLVRHPAYLGELLMVAACAASSPPLVAALLVPVVLVAVAARIGAEERLLCGSEAWVDYAARVPHRLVPGVW